MPVIVHLLRCLAARVRPHSALPIIVLLTLCASACSGSGSSSTPAPSPSADATTISAVAAAPSSGCTQSAVTAGAQTEQITVAGVARTYRRFVPATHDAPLPVVINLHGLLSNADQQVAISGFETLAETEHFIVLTPQGAGKIPGWDFTQSAGNTDIPVINAMLDEVESAACVDQARVYATGLSNGGMMSSLLACYEPERIAAVGLVSGIMHPGDCQASRAVPMIIFWGKQDPTLPYCGGVGPAISAFLSGKSIAGLPPPSCPPANFFGFPPVEDVVGTWVAADGCSASAAISQVSAHVEHRTYSGCKDDAAVEFYVVADGGHAWPGSAVMAALSSSPASALIGHTTDEIDASKLIWQFFQRFALTK